MLLIQAKLGGLTVLDANSPWSVALHLGNALFSFTLLIVFFARLLPEAAFAAPEPAAWRPLLGGLWLLVLGTMLTAAVTAKSGASLACYEWPACNGGWLPDLGDPQVRIHFIHRTLAALTGLGILAFLAAACRATTPSCACSPSSPPRWSPCRSPWVRWSSCSWCPVWAAVAHQAIGVLLFATVAAALATVLRAPSIAKPEIGHVVQHPLRSA